MGLMKDVSDIAAMQDELNLGLPPEQVLLMWVNYHLKNAGVNRTITDFGQSLAVFDYAFCDWKLLTH